MKNTGEEVLSRYRSRDRWEKLFDMLKNEIEQDRLRTGDNCAAEGQVFLSVVAFALRFCLESRMREGKLLQKHSADEILAELDKICSVNSQQGNHLSKKYRKDRGLSSTS